ncbi:MAG: NADH:ubiquinone reductase (Na(+)-transporting) subunit C [Bacteroidales bacterium]|nr:NADH:ubiquinone reductase (Na(+)-transporting) subunit C [Bacteroidales bacterium]
MKSFSNTYIFVFSTIMVVVVAALLSTAAMVLQPLQEKNIEIQKKRNILSSIRIENNAKNAEELYDKFISDSYVINADTEEKDESLNAFEIEMGLQMKKSPEHRSLPVFISSLDDGTKKYIVPVHGKGLWGPIYGFVSLNDDFITLYGAVFNHDDETPGLGAEINTDWFGAQFTDKKIFNNSMEFISIDLVKGGADPESLNEVDAISGGTLTSNGLEKMLYDCLGSYQTYFKNQMKNN